MRLGQLARKLSLRPAQIVEFLSKNNIQIEDNSNTRIGDDHSELVINHFSPGKFQQISEAVEEAEENAPVENELPKIEPVATLSETSEPQTKQETEIIRVPKIELSGLKVLGKIELPEPKKKEPVVENEEDVKVEDVIEPVTENTPKPERKPKNHNRNSIQQKRDRPKNWKNPLELQREREARAAGEKRRVEAEREKERRKRHYEEKRKSISQPKRVKASKEQPEIKRPVDTRPAPKTWLGKFLRWWTT